MTQIRTIALAMIWRGDQFLVTEFDDEDREGYYYRPLGGGVEFGEYAMDALRREIKEELRCDVDNIEYLTTLENIFTHQNVPSHEIVLLYRCRLLDESLYEQDHINFEDDGEPDLRAVWKPLSYFDNGVPPLYPDGLYEYLQDHSSQP